MDDEFCEKCHCKVAMNYDGEQAKRFCLCEWSKSKEKKDLVEAICSPFDWQEYREGKK
jgi:hypothetical protein